MREFTLAKHTLYERQLLFWVLQFNRALGPNLGHLMLKHDLVVDIVQGNTRG